MRRQPKYKIEMKDKLGNWSDDFTWNQGGNEMHSLKEANDSIKFIQNEYALESAEFRIVPLPKPICAECREPIGGRAYTQAKDGTYFHTKCWSNAL